MKQGMSRQMSQMLKSSRRPALQIARARRKIASARQSEPECAHGVVGSVYLASTSHAFRSR